MRFVTTPGGWGVGDIMPLQTTTRAGSASHQKLNPLQTTTPGGRKSVKRIPHPHPRTVTVRAAQLMIPICDSLVKATFRRDSLCVPLVPKLDLQHSPLYSLSKTQMSDDYLCGALVKIQLFGEFPSCLVN